MSAQAVLSQKEILQQVLCSVGPGEWAFVALVAKDWRDAYLLVPAQEMTGMTLEGRKSPFMCVPQCTLFSAAVVSRARMRILRKDRWRLASRHLQRAIGHWGSKAVFSSSKAHGMPMSEWVSIGALQSCSLSSLRWFVEKHDCPLPADASKVAAAHGSTRILSWLQERGVELSADLLSSAASNGQWKVIVYLRDRGLQWSPEVANRAARGGQLQVLRKLYKEKCPFAWETIAEHAARSGSIEVLQYLRQNPRVVFTKHTIYNAACNGHIAACEYLRSEGVPWAPSAYQGAARHKRLDTVVWLHEQGCPYNHYKAMLAAAEGGSVSVLAYLQQQHVEAPLGQPQLIRLLNAAGASGQLAAAQWLRAQGCVLSGLMI
jgi:hypothetical protein